MNNLTINQIFNFFCESKSSEEILFLGKFEVTSRDIRIAQATCQLIMDVNTDRGMMNIQEFRRKDDAKIDFMGSLSQNHFSKILQEKHRVSNKHIKIQSPALASYFVDKSSEDFKMHYQGETINFDLKSQYFTSSTNSLNINKKAHNRFKEHNSDFYIASIFRNKDRDYSDYFNVESVYYFLIPTSYIDSKAKLAFGKSPYYKIDIRDFIDRIA